MNKGEIMNNTYSSFWRDISTRSVDNILGWDEESIQDNTKDLIELSSKKHAISNFVQIVSGKNIPVRFATRGDSYTDGKSVVIGSKLDEKNFDKFYQKAELTYKSNFDRNNLYGFIKSKYSWHSVSRINFGNKNYSRKSININFYF